MNKCVFAGTFDPITNGHVAVVKKCLKMFDGVVIVIGENLAKSTLFSLNERIKMVKSVFSKEKNVEIICYSDFKSQAEYRSFLVKNEVCAYVRGIRNNVDFEYEQKNEKINKELYPEIVTIYLTADKEYKDISSTLIRDKIGDKADVSKHVPKEVLNFIKSE